MTGTASAGLTAILGCGFDPGVTGVFTAHAAKHHFSEIHYLDIVDCNAGDHGKAFATNFNPEINIREVTQKGKVLGERKMDITPSLMRSTSPLPIPGSDPRESYLIYHEELESLVRNFPVNQAGPVLDDIRTGVPDPSEGDTEHRHGPHRPGHV
ncbi:MAG: hypothetical protein MZV63_11795 [Marinilabiliales bacterium]|nr:hypothetical protein [Marinilabiliales bacterium]